MSVSTACLVRGILNKEILTVLKTAARVATTSNRHLPVLQNVLVAFSLNKISVTATDLEVWYTHTVTLECTAEPFSVLISTKFIRAMKVRDIVEFSPEFCRVGGSTYRPSFTPAEFPDLPLIQDPIEPMTLDPAYFIDFTACASQAATSEQRPTLQGVLHRGGELIGTDSCRLLIAKQGLTWGHNLVVPAKVALLITKVFSGKDDSYMHYNSTYACYQASDCKVMVRLIAGTYPDVSRIVPDLYEQKHGTIDNVQPWMEAANAAIRIHAAVPKRYRDPNCPIRLIFTGSTVCFSVPAAGESQQEYEATIPCNTGVQRAVTVNAYYLKDALQAVGGVGGAQIYPLLGSDRPTAPIVATSTDRLALILPIRNPAGGQ